LHVLDELVGRQNIAVTSQCRAASRPILYKPDIPVYERPQEAVCRCIEGNYKLTLMNLKERFRKKMPKDPDVKLSFEPIELLIKF